MNVKIGLYPSRAVCKFHRNYMDKKYSYDWPDKPTKFENFLEKLDGLIQWVYNHTINLYLDRKKREIKIRIDKQDTWGMFENLAMIILPMLKQLKVTKQGAPWVDDTDVPDNLGIRSTDIAKKENDWDDNVFKRWDWVMGEMIWAFEQIVDENSDDKFFSEDYKLDIEAYNNWQARKQNGLRLFGKFFENLWD